MVTNPKRGTFKTQSAAKIEMFTVSSPLFTCLFVVVNYETMDLPGRGSRLVTGVADMMDYRLRVKCRQKVCPVNKNQLI